MSKLFVAILSLIMLAGMTFAINVSACQEITSGGTYDLIGNLNGDPFNASEMSPSSTTACIKIAATSVVLDCHGYSITGTGGAGTIGVAVNGTRSGILITDCPDITLFEEGIRIHDASNTIIYDNGLHGNSEAGIYIDRGASLYVGLNNASDNSLYGIVLANVSNSYVEMNLLDNNGLNGFPMSTVTGTTIHNNTVSNSGNNAMFIGINSTGNTLSHNRIQGNDGSGLLLLTGASGNSVTDNVISNSANWGLSASVSSGNNTYTDNNITSNGQTIGLEGVLISGNSGGNTFSGNRISGNYDDGILFTLGSGNNVLSGNTIFGNSGDGIAFDSVGGNTLSNNNVYSNANNGFFLDSSTGNTFNGDNSTNNIEDGFNLQSSPDNIFTDVRGSLNGDAGFDASNSSNILIDPSIFCDNSDHGLYVALSDNLTILDSVFCDNTADDGLFVSNVNNSLIQGNLVSGNLNGIFLASSRNVTVNNNTAWGNSNNGIELSTSPGNLVTNNLAHGNTFRGIEVSTLLSTDNVFTNNSAYENRYGFDITADNQTLSDNTAFNNSINGIYIFDSNNTVVTNDHYYNNALDMVVESAFSWPFDLYLVGVIFDNPTGNYSNYTNISLTDNVDLDGQYSIDWDSEPAPLLPEFRSFEGKFVNISREFGAVSIDHIVWNWLESELLLDSYIDTNFRLAKFNTSDNWTFHNSTPDDVANTISLSDVDTFSTFAVWEFGGGDDDDNGGGSSESFTVSFNTSCDNSTVTVLDAGLPVDEVEVLVDNANTLSPVASGNTDSNGTFTFTGCGVNVKITAKKDGYGTEVIAEQLVSCGSCAVECNVDADCPEGELCIANICAEPVAVPECVLDTDCTGNETCVEGVCIEPVIEPEAECVSDSECSAADFCNIPSGQSGGSCEPVTGECGYADNHSWVVYECGTGAGCALCPSGYVCTDNECEETSALSGPISGFVGENVTLSATKGGLACAGCNVTVTSPDGRTFSGKTDSEGGFSLPLNMEGTYKLVMAGAIGAESTVDALPKPAPDEPEKPTETGGLDFSILFLLLLLLIVVGAILYWRSRSK